MKKLFFLLLMIMPMGPINCLASTDQLEIEFGSGLQLSSKWFQGRHLIFDCVHNHYVCTGEWGHEKCLRDQDLDLKSTNKKQLTVRCTVLKSFESQKECIEKQYQLIGLARPMPFCLKALLR